jgi:hypothetical protein
VSDNSGVYILESKGNGYQEYRVAKLTNIQEIYGKFAENNKFAPNPKAIREKFGSGNPNVKFALDFAIISLYASDLTVNEPYLEDGVMHIRNWANKTFEEICGTPEDTTPTEGNA